LSSLGSRDRNATGGKNKYGFFFLKKMNPIHHIVCCPHSRLAMRQPNGVISVLAGPLSRRLAALICILHPTGCTTGWVKYANERSQAATERSSQDAYDAIRLTHSKAAVWTTDYVVNWIHFFQKKESIFIFTPGSITIPTPEGRQKCDPLQNSTLFII